MKPGESETRHYGLIGYPLTHSFSPDFFKEKFEKENIDAAYTAFALQDVEELHALLARHPELRGINVTTPHKQTVLPLLHERSDDAASIGAVNCISIQDGKLFGDNTDWAAFRDSLRPLLPKRHLSALVLGSGGASLAVRYALEKMEIPFKVVSRQQEADRLSYESITGALIASHQLIINTTTLGTLGAGLPPLPYDALTPEHLLYDLVYNPPLTPFLEKGKAAGATIKNGLEMLHLQAEASWDIWQDGTSY